MPFRVIGDYRANTTGFWTEFDCAVLARIGLFMDANNIPCVEPMSDHLREPMP